MKQCPSCKTPYADPAEQCGKCGLIYSKWRDPKMREAEARLLAMGAAHSKGFPKWLIYLGIFLVVFPLLVIFVPDVGVPLLGAKLYYRFVDKKTYSFTGKLDVDVSVPAVGRVPFIVDKFQLNMKNSITVLETDSGGNTTLRAAAERIWMVCPLATPPELEKPTGALIRWSRDWVINRRGGFISTMMTNANQVRQNAEASKMHHAMRSGRAQDYADNGPRMRHENSTPEPEAVVTNPYEIILNDLDGSQTGPIDRSTFFEYTAARIKKGTVMKTPQMYSVRNKWFGVDIPDSVELKMTGFKRQANGFMIILEWDQKINPRLADSYGAVFNLLNSAVLTGTYHGKATINYKDGIIDKWEGEYDIMIHPMMSNTFDLFKTMGVVEGLESGAPSTQLELKITENISRT